LPKHVGQRNVFNAKMNVLLTVINVEIVILWLS
jgi:hypothetical protein